MEWDLQLLPKINKQKNKKTIDLIMTLDPRATIDNTLQQTTLIERKQQRMSNEPLTQNMFLHSKTTRQCATEWNRISAGVMGCVFNHWSVFNLTHWSKNMLIVWDVEK